MGSVIIDQDFPYDILHRGKRDEARHNKRVDEAVRKQLKDIISQQDIITNEGNKKVKVRLKYLDQHRFIYNRDRLDEVGRDQFDELETDEVLQRPEKGSAGSPVIASDEAGEAIYEAEYSLDELTDMMAEELALPDLDERKKNEIVSEVLEWTDRRKKTGIKALLDKRSTIKANILRRAKLPKNSNQPTSIIDEDLRYRTWNITQEKHSNAVIFLMMDRSGSMWQDKIYAVKALYFWIVRFLRRRYDKVEIKFIAHDITAREIPEKEFFSIADSGGTKVSSAYYLCKDMIKHNYSVNMWNIYCFHASDGDSWYDEEYCMELVGDILDLGAIMFAYTEIDIDNYREEDSKLLQLFRAEQKNKDGILISVISEMAHILTALRTFLKSTVRQSY